MNRIRPKIWAVIEACEARLATVDRPPPTADQVRATAEYTARLARIGGGRGSAELDAAFAAFTATDEESR